jgi:hypothetical protein
MKKASKRKALMLIPIGVLVIATSQILSRFIELPDLAKGSFIGLGIGLVLTSFIFGGFKLAK